MKRIVSIRIIMLLVILVTSLSSRAQTRFDYFFLEAEKCRLAEDWSAAMELYEHCLDIRPDAPEALYHLGRINMYLRRDSIGMSLFKRALALEPNNPWYLETLASLYLNQRNTDEAVPLLEKMSQLQSTRTDVLSQLEGIYKSLGRTEDAIRTLDRIEVLEGKMSQITDEKYVLYMDMGDSVRAFNEVVSLCNEFPHDQNYKLHLGYCYQQCGNFQKAKEIYDSVAVVDPENVYMKSALLSYYKDSGDSVQYKTLRDSILYSPNTPAELRAATMSEYIQSESRDSVGDAHIQEVFQKVLAQTPNNIQMLGMYVGFLLYRQCPDELIADVMNQILALEPDDQLAMKWLLEYYAKNENYASLEEICRRGVNYHPEVIGYHFYLALTLSQQDKDSEAAQVLETGLKSRSEDESPDIVSEMFTLLGDMYYKIHQPKEAFCAYDSALVYRSDNVVCLNNYAYYLSLEANELDRAEGMGYLAIKAEPNNKTYLDTYAWILFTQGKYTEAQHYMDRVVPRDSTDEYIMGDSTELSNLLEHAGDIAWFCGDQQQALRLWNLAAKKNDKTATPILAKKLKKKKYIKTKNQK